MIPDEDLHRHAIENFDKADALLFGRVTYEMMEEGWRYPPPGATPDWWEAFARTIDEKNKYVVSSPKLFAGLSKLVDLKLVGRQELRSGAVAMQYETR
jgi:hypothetical protein